MGDTTLPLAPADRRTADNGADVYVLLAWYPSRRDHYHATGEWSPVGVVADEGDAQEWSGAHKPESGREAHQHDRDRRYVPFTVGVAPDESDLHR